MRAALELLAAEYAPGRRGIRLRELAGGWTLASDPATEEAARRLFSRPRTATLTPAQAETLAIVAYLQPVSRPEITRIRGVSADSATATLLERGLIEEAGHSQFGAILYRTGTQFLKLFGLNSLEDLPDIAQWDPTPQESAELRERLLRAGEARAGGGPLRGLIGRGRRRRPLPLTLSLGPAVVPDRDPTTAGGKMSGSTTEGIKTVLHPVSDLAASKPVYAALLGVEPIADAPYYVGFETGGQQIGLVPGGGPQAMTSPVAFWHVADIEAKLAEVTAAGATLKEAAHDVGGGRLVATVTDPDGNVLGLLQDP